jgi:hypothetical protein
LRREVEKVLLLREVQVNASTRTASNDERNKFAGSAVGAEKEPPRCYNDHELAHPGLGRSMLAFEHG